MSRRRNSVMEGVKKQYVRMALEAGNMSFIARKLGMSTSTLSDWVNLYRDEVEREMANEGVFPMNQPPTPSDLQAKYEKAMKLLGEKELEVALLREQLKKNFPV
jgi:transposase